MKKIIVIWLLACGVAFADGSGAAPVVVPETPEHKACVEALNKDPAFAASIIHTADKQIDQKMIDAHDEAIKKIAENDSHVLWAYAALWVIAAALVAYMFVRQQKLRAEIDMLRRDLTKAEGSS